MENFRIESLEINKIGAFEHIKMDFPKKTDPDKAEIHILTGENGTGKSTVLHLLSHCVPFEESWLIEKFQSSRQSSFIIDASLYDQPVKIKANDKYFDNNLKNIDEEDLKLYFKNYADLPKELLYYPEIGVFPFSLFAYSGYRKLSEIETNGIKPLNKNPLENSLDFDKSINPNLFVQWVTNTQSNYALNFLKLVHSGEIIELNKVNKLYREPLELIESIISQVIGQSMKFEVEGQHEVRIRIEKNQTIPFNHLPDGLKSIISWIGDLLMRMDRIEWFSDTIDIFDRNFILFLDEIEVHLHPAWQRKILLVVQKLFKNAQIFISTHSPFVVGSVDGAWVHKLKKEGAYAVLDGEPTLSNDGKTFVQILSDTFDITSLFGEQNERKILRFKEIKDLILSGQEYNETEFNTLIDELGKESRALENLIGLEIRQINKTLGIDILATHATI
jgi:predicted ATP-binding protein involved in virulence